MTGGMKPYQRALFFVGAVAFLGVVRHLIFRAHNTAFTVVEFGVLFAVFVAAIVELSK